MERKGRIEDGRLLQGHGRYTDDQGSEGALWAVFVRSPFASADLQGVDTSEAETLPGVVVVLTAEDLAADGVGPVQAPLNVQAPDGRSWTATERGLLAGSRLRHVGEPIAMVLAETRAVAMDAAEAVFPAMEERAAVTTIATARAPDARLVHDDRPGNLAFHWEAGDAAATEDALAASLHRVRADVPVTRVTAAAMEPRAALAEAGTGGDITLHVSHQNPTALRAAICETFQMDPVDLRVVAGDVGASFGMKAGPLREEMLVAWAARKLGRAVRWRADRSEGFLSDEGGRDMRAVVDLGLDAAGNFTALNVHLEVNIGAYASGRSNSAVLNIGGVAGVYRTPLIAGQVDAYLSNVVPVAAYRGAGRPEATYFIESAIDIAARELGFDRIELRRRNLISTAEMPWDTRFLFSYDSGAFEAVLDAGLAQADVAGFAERRQLSERKGKLRGLGVAMCVETAGGTILGPGRDWTDLEILPDGSLQVAVGAFSAGQGLETSFTDLVAGRMGVSADRVTYVQGDTALVEQGAGMGGSGAMVKGASALMDAADKVITLASEIAGEELEASAADIEYAAGVFRIAGTDRQIPLESVARVAGERGIRLIGKGEFETPVPSFPNGCHVCEVEIDPMTGQVTPLADSAVEDIGRVINAQLAEGQIQGGVAQALGQVLGEEMRYDGDDGQLLTGSFMDYPLPRAADLPRYRTGFRADETAMNPLGVKGVGEAGSVGGLAAGMSAVRDALATAGVESFDMPASPGRVWTALNAAKAPE